MHIAYLAQSYPPMISGAALVVEGLAKTMAKRGHQVLVIAASDTGQTYRMEKQNLTVLRLRSWHNPLRVRQRFLLYPHRPVMKSLREFAPAIVHVHEPLQLSLLGIEYAKRANIPAILTVHQIPSLVASYMPDPLKDHITTLLWMYARIFISRFTFIVTPTQTISRLVTQMARLQTNTISSGVDVELFHPPSSREGTITTRRKWNLPPRAPILLHVGRLDAEKCVERVIQAAAHTLKQTDAHLLLIGDGSQKHNLVELCHKLQIAERVHFTGFVSLQEGLPELYRVASVFVTASEIETQGIVLLEAAATGLPIVAVRATCLHEIVEDGINGFLTKSGDAHGMALAMNALLENPDKAKQMGKASRVLVQKHKVRYTWDAHEKLYGELARQPLSKPLAVRGRCVRG